MVIDLCNISIILIKIYKINNICALKVKILENLWQF